jgi:hypothetical protein
MNNWPNLTDSDKKEMIRLKIETSISIDTLAKTYKVDEMVLSKFLKNNGVKIKSGRFSLEEFVNKARSVHENFYDYSRVEYTKSNEKIEIICPEHGIFNQQANSHLQGHGCPQCYHERAGVQFKLNQQDFLDKSTKAHGDRYDYSLSYYKTTLEKVTIICPLHGTFLQTPKDHFQGKGCAICANRYKSNGERKICTLSEENQVIFEFNSSLGCRNKDTGRLLRFDFYLPELNIAIEYDGIQHFLPVKRWGGKEGLESGQKRDRMKEDHCELLNIYLLRISYQEDIEKSLINSGIISAVRIPNILSDLLKS